MLALTADAAEVIREIVDSAPEHADANALRISMEGEADGGEPQLAMALASAPEATDETVEQHGATVYVSEAASQLLGDKILDAHAHESHVHFTIAAQGDGGEPV